MRRRKAASARDGSERWLVSYADLMTLLFAFFTTMYAISTVDAKKLAPAATSIQEAFDTQQAKNAPVTVDGPPRLIAPMSIVPPGRPLDAIRAQLELALADAVTSGRIELLDEARGLVLSLPEAATFPVGRAEVTPPARELIGRIAATLQPLDNAVRIEGHTDDVPIHTARYASNWELSTARASAVVAFLIEGAGMAPGRLSAAGYAEFHPRVPNDTPANRALNRRIDIVVLNSAAGEVEEPGAAGRSR